MGLFGIDHDQRARARRDQCFDLCRIGVEAVLRPAAVMHGLAAVQRHRCRPQWIVGRGNQHFVAIAQQRAQRHVDEFAGAVADEDGLGGAATDAPVLLLQQNRLARRIDTLLVGISFCLRQILHQRQAQDLRRTETIGTGIADVQRDDLVTLSFQLDGTARERTANLVTDVLQAVAGLDAGIVFHALKFSLPRTGQPESRILQTRD